MEGSIFKSIVGSDSQRSGTLDIKIIMLEMRDFIYREKPCPHELLEYMQARR